MWSGQVSHVAWRVSIMGIDCEIMVHNQIVGRIRPRQHDGTGSNSAQCVYNFERGVILVIMCRVGLNWHECMYTYTPSIRKKPRSFLSINKFFVSVFHLQVSTMALTLEGIQKSLEEIKQKMRQKLTLYERSTITSINNLNCKSKPTCPLQKIMLPSSRISTRSILKNKSKRSKHL